MTIPHPTELLMAVLLPVVFAVVGAGFAGDGITAWYPALQKPRFNISIPVFMVVGVIYAMMCGALLYRLWTVIPATQHRLLALVVLSFMMGANEAWNFVMFRLRDLWLSMLGMIAFALIVVLLWWILLPLDAIATLLLTPYMVWMVYDIAWIRALWKLNPANQE